MKPEAVAIPVDLADSDVRLHIATTLPSEWSGGPDGADVATMIRLSEDPDPEVRNWATFGLGFLMDVDSEAIRAALWARTGDDSGEVRAEGIRGLARRHDRRAVPLLAELLDDEDGAHVLTFTAAAVLGSPELLPHVLNYDPADAGVAEALAACDPVTRGRRDEMAAVLPDSIARQLPGADVALFAECFEPGLTLKVSAGAETFHWSVEALLKRAGGDPEEAARLAAGDTLTEGLLKKKP
jgi:hypothetical protein